MVVPLSPRSSGCLSSLLGPSAREKITPTRCPDNPILRGRERPDTFWLGRPLLLSKRYKLNKMKYVRFIA
jgi:hypothetical protein